MKHPSSLCLLVLCLTIASYGQSAARITVPERLMLAKIVKQRGPAFTTAAPEAQKFMRAGGNYEVRFRAVIDANGNVSEVRAISGDPWLIKIARPAVMQWRFQPSSFDDDPVEVETTLTVHFSFPKP
jgi:outer membrane biosynthesis protein TonB